jgi:dTDP-4-amino-4,6-dideoxygalactose transaminase
MLISNNVQVRKIYPYPIHKMKAYKTSKNLYKKKLINTENKSNGIFCLPLYPELKTSDIKKVIRILIMILKKNNL